MSVGSTVFGQKVRRSSSKVSHQFAPKLTERIGKRKVGSNGANYIKILALKHGGLYQTIPFLGCN
jgi:hypothetical protein